MLRKNEFPEPSWSLDRLQNWCRASLRRLATDAWWVGTALIYAEKKIKEEGRWMQFCKDSCPGLSYETIRRYIRLAQAVNDPQVLEDLELNKAYQLAFIVPVKAKATKPAEPHSTPGKPPTSTSGSGQPPKDDPPEADELDDPDDPARKPDDHQRHLQPGTHLDFFAAKVAEQLDALQQMPKQERWKDLDVERLRNNLEALRNLVERALKDLPKRRRKAG